MAHVIDYLQPGPLTGVDAAHAWVLQELPADPMEIWAVAQALVVRPVDAHILGLPAHRIEERTIRPVRGLIAVLAQLYPERLYRPRPPATRIVGTSRHVAVLACTLLRTRGFPARVRAGFVTHAGHLTGEDLWVTEFWAGAERRWIRTHPDPPGDESAAMNPASVGFLSGGEAWQQYRGGLLPQKPPDGAVSNRRWEPVGISSTTVRDLAALCQVEMLPDDVWGRMAQVHEGRMPAAYDNLIDVTAAVCARGDTADLARLFSTGDLAVPRHLLS
ncbi:transglutaminase domain-containing protein [Streptomyces sp. NPDC048643]|uniref:transglutaminase domain-containing protein n=1 Tax=Streptomyces sp. NPDC048643 TaxID=3155637 RepID=UPI0034128D60